MTERMTEEITLSSSSSSSPTSSFLPNPGEGGFNDGGGGGTQKGHGTAFQSMRNGPHSSQKDAKPPANKRRRTGGAGMRMGRLDEMFARSTVKQDTAKKEIVISDDDDDDDDVSDDNSDVATQKPAWLQIAEAAATTSVPVAAPQATTTTTTTIIPAPPAPVELSHSFVSRDEGVDNGDGNHDVDDRDNDGEDDDEEVPTTPEGTVLADDSHDGSDKEMMEREEDGPFGFHFDGKRSVVQSSQIATTTDKNTSGTKSLSLSERFKIARIQETRLKQREIDDNTDDDVIICDVNYGDSHSATKNTSGLRPFHSSVQSKDHKEHGITSHSFNAFSQGGIDAFSQLTGYKSAQTTQVPAPYRRTVVKDFPLRPRVTTPMPVTARPSRPEPQSTRRMSTVTDREFAMLSAEQREVLDHALDGESFFFTGAAGTGKSFLLRCIISALQNKLGEGSVFVTARFVNLFPHLHHFFCSNFCLTSSFVVLFSFCFVVLG